MITSRVSTSASAIMTSAATHAVEPVMRCAMLNRAIAGPAPLLAATAKASRAPTPPIHMLADSQPPRPLPPPHGKAPPPPPAPDPHAGPQPARPAERPAVSPQAQSGGQAAD